VVSPFGTNYKSLFKFLYRIEPLVCKEFISKRPVIIPYHKGGRRLHIGFQVRFLRKNNFWIKGDFHHPRFLSAHLFFLICSYSVTQELTEDLAGRSQAIMNHLNFVKVNKLCKISQGFLLLFA
jgi:hypothetical protein